VDILNRNRIPTYAYPDRAARAFTYMWQYSDNLRHIYETPEFADYAEDDMPDRAGANAIIAAARQAGRTILTEVESKQLLATYGIPTVETRVAATAAEAVKTSDTIGYPVVLKLYSETITHKTDVGGVKLNLQDRAAVEKAFEEIRQGVTAKAGAQHFQGVAVQPMIKLDGYELIVGSSIDSQFGPVLLFGLGGQLVEVFKDRALGLPPLTATLARRMMERTNIFHALKGVRGRKPVNLLQLEKIMVRFSQLVVEQPWIKESDINPLLASDERLIAVDARFVLHDVSLSEDRLPKPAIRPYPAQYQMALTLKDHTRVTLRPIRPEDEPMMVQFHKTLSERSVYLRYTHPIDLRHRIAHDRLTRICFVDYDRELVVAVLHRDEKAPQQEIIAVGRLSRVRDSRDAKFAILISDPFQHRGLGTQLVRKLLDIARSEKIARVIAEILPDNVEMQHICRKLGFELGTNDKGLVTAEIALT
jgi:acetyltransferase